MVVQCFYKLILWRRRNSVESTSELQNHRKDKFVLDSLGLCFLSDQTLGDS